MGRDRRFPSGGARSSTATRVYGDPELTVTDLEFLATRAGKGGKGDDVDWPGVDALVPHYLKSGSNNHTTYVDIKGVHYGDVAGHT